VSQTCIKSNIYCVCVCVRPRMWGGGEAASASESSTEVVPLFNFKNKDFVIPPSALQRLLSTFQKCWHYFSLV
jgi:hypothetical protein